MFLGQHSHKLDLKGRVVLPSRFREQLDEECFVVQGRDRQLLIFPPVEYQRHAAEVRTREDASTRAGRRYQRQFFGSSDAQTLDKAGRLLIRAELRDWAGLTEGGEVKVLGLSEYIELWNPQSLEADQAKGIENYTWDEEDAEDL